MVFHIKLQMFLLLGECGRVPIAMTYMTRCLKY